MREITCTFSLYRGILGGMSKLVDIERLAEETGFSVRELRTFTAGKKIPFFKFGHRTMRFDTGKVIKALQRFEVPAVSGERHSKNGGRS
jgi:hypothetical protein